jgi:hypothetical protein
MVICEHAKECEFSCDGKRPVHKYPHDESVFCRPAKCLQSGIVVKCIEVKK